MRYLAFLMIVAASMLVGCDDPTKVFEENHDIPNQVWNKDHMVEFSFDISDTTQFYDILVNLRHTTFYPNSNLWVMVYTTYPNDTVQQQRLQLTLADEKGQWFGDCTGDICTVQQYIQQRVFFNQVGTYKLAFEQIMRTDDLADILAFGLRVEVAKAPKAKVQEPAKEQ